ncbi:hypothetical protein diail_4704 [Diaporthe ilicicola]|nr:hypothetical protein diail_4704 [Diaporthe ilicicola]
MTMLGSEEVLAQMSQESHLLSPEISAAGSDHGNLDDLKGEPFSELIETDRPRPTLANETTATARTPFHHQQASLKTPSSLVNPGTCSTSKSRPTSKSKSNRQPATQQSAKSSNAKMGSKTVPSATRRAAAIKIQIVRPASHPLPPSSSSSSSSSSATHKARGALPQQPDGDRPSYSFTMNLLPMTKIRELCLHAAGHARRHFDAVLDGSRFEARDRDGHVFQGHETMSEEILTGETIYLVEGGLDARGAAKGAGEKKPRAGGRERGRLLCLKSLDLEETEGGETRAPYRTPSVSSRASSSRGGTREREKEKAEPRMTPSQKALAIAQMGRTPMSEQPAVEKSQTVSSAARRSLPSPALDMVEETNQGGPVEIDNLEVDFVAASLLRSTSPPPPPPQPEIPPHLKDSQLVIPDSQDPFSQGFFSQQSIEPPSPSSANGMPDASDATRPQSHPSPRVKATTTTTQPQLPSNHASPLLPPTSSTSRPDPYDISNVLSDDEGERPDGRSTATKTKMASSVRKLGSATNKRQPVAPPPVLLPSPHLRQSTQPLPSRANTAGAAPAAAGADGRPSTPSKKRTPIKAEPSSPAVPLPSSPTTHVAAAIARGSSQRAVARTRQPQLPSPGQAVIAISSDSDSDDALIDEVFRDLSGSAPPPSLPWSAPPLRAGRAASVGVDQPARRRGSVSSTAGEVKYETLVANKAPSSPASPKKSPRKTTPRPSPIRKSGQKSPGKKSLTQSPARKSIIRSPSKKEEATIIHDSSSAEEDAPIIKREPSSDSDISRKAKLAAIPASPEKTHHVEKQQPVVIELSSGSDSDIEPSTEILEDDEAELPSIDLGLLARSDKLPSPTPADQSPAAKSPETNPIKPEPAYEEPPPSAQPSKRKRKRGATSKEEPDSEEEERRKKKLRKREAKKARRRLDRAAERAALADKEEKELAALQEARKKLALEEAHRRALELEIVVSSPARRESAPSVTRSDETDNDDSGLGCSSACGGGGDDAGAGADADPGRAAGVPLDGDDKNDSLLSGKGAEGRGLDHRPSWRELSKRHLSSSPPQRSQARSSSSPAGKEEEEDSAQPTASLPTSTPAIIEAQLQQCVEERFHRMPFDDWAFLESTLGRSLGGGGGGGGYYSPLEVHTRVHLDMVRRAAAQQHGASYGPAEEAPLHGAVEEEEDESGVACAATGGQDEPEASVLPVLPGPAEDDEEDAPPPPQARSDRSGAPSPNARGEREKRKAAKNQRRLRRERARKKERCGKVNVRYHHEFRTSRAGLKKKKKKSKKQKGH